MSIFVLWWKRYNSYKHSLSFFSLSLALLQSWIFMLSLESSSACVSGFSASSSACVSASATEKAGTDSHVSSQYINPRRNLVSSAIWMMDLCGDGDGQEEFIMNTVFKSEIRKKLQSSSRDSSRLFQSALLLLFFLFSQINQRCFVRT